jgi:hypothetical protein
LRAAISLIDGEVGKTGRLDSPSSVLAETTAPAGTPKIPGRDSATKSGRLVRREDMMEFQSSREGAVGLEGVCMGLGRLGAMKRRP